MNSYQKYLTITASVVVILLAGCGRDDVAPANTSQTAIQENAEPPVSTTASNTLPEQQEAAGRVEEADIIPDEYTTNNGGIDRLAIVTLQPTAGNTTSGMVAFIHPDVPQAAIRVVGKIINITPGLHGFHIHEIGNCQTPDASSAGDHLNPAGAQHAGHEAAVRHLGDLGNLVAQSDGTAVIDFYDDQLQFTGMNSIIGKSFIIHADEDDLTTQPSGNSGARIACGVIENRQPDLVPQ